MRAALAATAAAALLAISQAAAADLPDLEGIWINQTIIATAKRTRSVRAAVRQFPLITEIAVARGVSRVRLTNEVEAWNAEFRVLPGGDLLLPRLAGGADAVLRPGVRGRAFALVVPKYATRYVFRHQRVPVHAAFRTALNAELIAGSYHDPGLGPPHAGNEVRFSPDGRLSGLSGFDGYELCIAGDCAAMSEQDLIELRSRQGMKPFLFRFNARVLTLLHAANTAQPDEKPSFVAGGIFLELWRAGPVTPIRRGKKR